MLFLLPGSIWQANITGFIAVMVSLTKELVFETNIAFSSSSKFLLGFINDYSIREEQSLAYLTRNSKINDLVG